MAHVGGDAAREKLQQARTCQLLWDSQYVCTGLNVLSSGRHSMVSHYQHPSDISMRSDMIGTRILCVGFCWVHRNETTGVHRMCTLERIPARSSWS